MKPFNVTIHRSYPNYPELVKIMITGESIAISLLNYGGTISKLMIADRWGQKKNIVLNYPNESEYIRQRSFIGAAVGRVAGRISQGLWSSDYGNYQLEKKMKMTALIYTEDLLDLILFFGITKLLRKEIMSK
ncbi:aldose epimerase family protein [Enterococcus rivorum]|uniref:aldose epimerase family protein n=1 Tax=Enterococcus rivorum TaxID=762845 RepID=UPI003629C2F7